MFTMPHEDGNSQQPAVPASVPLERQGRDTAGRTPTSSSSAPHSDPIPQELNSADSLGLWGGRGKGQGSGKILPSHRPNTASWH